MEDRRNGDIEDSEIAGWKERVLACYKCEDPVKRVLFEPVDDHADRLLIYNDNPSATVSLQTKRVLALQHLLGCGDRILADIEGCVAILNNIFLPAKHHVKRRGLC